MKKLFLSLCVIFLVLGVCSMSGCGKDKTLRVTATSKLSEYDVSTHTTGQTVENKMICCGERYKLSFDFDFTNIEEVLKKDEKLNVAMIVKLGVYENEDNKALLQSRYIPDGINFSSIAPGVWKANFVLSKDDIPDFQKGYFIIGIDSLGLKDNFEEGDYSEISVNFELTDEEEKEDKEFKFGGSDEYIASLLPSKGNFKFTQKDNVVTQIGAEAKQNNMTIFIPSKCDEITIEFYEDASKARIYGTEKFDSSSDKAAFENNELSIILGKYVENFLGSAKYNEMLSVGKIPVYLVITAIGGNNYNDAVIEMSFDIN